MAATIKLIDKNTLPNTYKAVQENFSDPALRSKVWEAAKWGSVLGLARRIALTAHGKAGLQAVEEVLSGEWRSAGFAGVHIGDADPSIYGDGQVAAYLDQPTT